MDTGEPRAGREPLDEDDHDLLTFNEAGERLRAEISNAETALDSARASGDDEAINSASTRLTALLEAATRNRAGTINDANFEKFFGYPGTAKRNLTHRSSNE
ncbi:acyl-CoA synthetase [Nocardia gamkensis]|uniref:acyl-CoA synthetase n=1 Tax=Nocardia gamkensis TaxID=352869 RepID=UPI0036E54587